MRRLLSVHLGAALGILCYYAILWPLDVSCPILWLTGYPCPTCGCTRAMLSLLRLDFAGYLSYQPLALPLGLSVLGLLHHRRLPSARLRSGVFWASAALLGLNLLRYLWKLISL